MIRRPPRSTLSSSSAASDVYKRQPLILSPALTRHAPATGQPALEAWVRIAIPAVGMADPLHWTAQTGVDVEATPHGLQRFDDPSPRTITHEDGFGPTLLARPGRHPHNQRLPRTAGPAPGGVRVELGGRDFGRDGAQRRTGRVYRRGPRRLSGDP